MVRILARLLPPTQCKDVALLSQPISMGGEGREEVGKSFTWAEAQPRGPYPTHSPPPPPGGLGPHLPGTYFQAGPSISPRRWEEEKEI